MEAQENPSGKLQSVVYKVEGLDCAEEVILLKRVLGNDKRIRRLEFNILQSKMTVSFDPQQIQETEIVALVRKTGMRALPWDKMLNTAGQSFWPAHGRLILTFLSGICLLTGMVTRSFAPYIAIGFYVTAMACGAWYVLPKAYLALRRFSPDMNLLMVIAICGSAAIQEWFEGATVAFLFSVALLLEQWSIGRARRAVLALMDLAPNRARVISSSGDRIELPVEQVPVGSFILVKPGEKIPLDAVITQGSSYVDQSPITGESMPVLKQEGDEVFAGTLNADGALTCQVTKPAEETTLARITHLVEEARSGRSESEQWTETFAHYYTPIMLLFAVLTMILPPFFWGEAWFIWIYHGLVLLVIACPCALVISTPVAIVCGLTAAAKGGVLVKGGLFLELVGKLQALAVDKTGTLTYGHPVVQSIIALNGHTIQDLMQKAVALEQGSEHPLARAILQRGKEMGIRNVSVEHYQAVKGKGALATYKGKLHWIGSHRFMHEMRQETDEIHNQALVLEDAGHSVVAIGNDTHVCGLISIADNPRVGIRSTIESIKRCGIKEVVMLTGDNIPTAQDLARLAGVDRFYAELLPEDKVEKILELTKTWEVVGMVGDGVNDAPAMATASVGIAMGGIGAPVAIEAADIALMSDDFAKLPWLIAHAQRVLRIIKQNITFSLGVKGLFILLAFLNLATLWMAIAADTGATLLVIFNALRLLRAK